MPMPCSSLTRPRAQFAHRPHPAPRPAANAASMRDVVQPQRVQARQLAQVGAGLLQAQPDTQRRATARWPRAGARCGAHRALAQVDRQQGRLFAARPSARAARRSTKPALASDADVSISSAAAVAARSPQHQRQRGPGRPAGARRQRCAIGSQAAAGWKGPLCLPLQAHRTLQMKQPAHRVEHRLLGELGASFVAARRLSSRRHCCSPPSTAAAVVPTLISMAKAPRCSARASALSARASASPPPTTRQTVAAADHQFGALASTVANAARSASTRLRAVSAAMPAAGRYSARSLPFRRPVSAPSTCRG